MTKSKRMRKSFYAGINQIYVMHVTFQTTVCTFSAD